MFSTETLRVIFQPSDESSSSETKEPLTLEVDIPEDFDMAIQNVWRRNGENNNTLMKDFYKEVVKTFRESKYIFRDKSYTVINNYNTHYLKKIWMFLYKEYGNDDNTNNYNKVDDIIKDINKDLKIKNVTEPWPYGKVRRRINQTDAKRAQRVVDYVNKLDDNDLKLLQDYLREQNPELNNITRDTIIEAYKKKGVNKLIGHINKANEDREIRDEYNKKIKSYKEVIQKYTLPNLKLNDGWSVVELENLEKTNITYPITVLQKGGSNIDIFFGKNNFIIKYKPIDNVGDILKGKQPLDNLEIENNNKILFDKTNNVSIEQFFDNISEDNEAKLIHLKLQNGDSLQVNTDMEGKFATPDFIKPDENDNPQTLNKEQALIVQQPPQNWLIFHDPGVGKTLNALAVAVKNLGGKGNIHVVAPSKSILQQWQETLEKFIDSDKTTITLTTQTQAMFIKVCNEGSKGSFYDY
ncbi:MAG: hypothetical protein CMO44_17450, partial [Verrucomicrobiales bacterium]|nr:hypothetical protein [Verrucomicrobiales bacterium]